MPVFLLKRNSCGTRFCATVQSTPSAHRRWPGAQGRARSTSGLIRRRSAMRCSTAGAGSARRQRPESPGFAPIPSPRSPSWGVSRPTRHRTPCPALSGRSNLFHGSAGLAGLEELSPKHLSCLFFWRALIKYVFVRGRAPVPRAPRAPSLGRR